MGRIIDITFNGKDYVIEFNRETVLKLMTSQTNKPNQNGIDMIYDFIYYGLLKNHKDDMPTKEVVTSWIISMGDQAQGFVNELSACVKDVLEVIEQDKKQGNFKWGVRK